MSQAQPAPAAEFPAADRAGWLDEVDQVARKAGLVPADAPPGAGEAALTRTDLDGIAIRPLYTAADVDPGPRSIRDTAGWDVRQRHADPDPRAVAEAILADLTGGVTSIWLAVGPGGTAVADLPVALADVRLDLAPVVLDGGSTAVEAAEAFLALAAARGVPASDLLGNLGLDPIGLLARTGVGPDVASTVPLARRVARSYPHLRVVVADATPVHAAGGSAAQEVGFGLAAGVAYLRELVGAGLDLGVAARLIEFRFAATADQFGTIATLRAARRCWSRVTQACGQARPMHIHAVGSPTMLTRRDPYVNLLRGTIAGFAAGVGGADAITVPPFDAAIGADEPFYRRIARNTQALLTDEAQLARVLDPAGGSWYVESRTAALARAAWAFFQEIEAAGGAVAVLSHSWLDRRVGATRARRERAVATRRAPLTGISEFPDLHEAPVPRRSRPEPAPVGGGLPVYRPAAPFETFRDRSDAIAAATGSRPQAFLATLGPQAAHAARAGFARNLLQVGGIETVAAGETRTSDQVVAAFVEAGSPVAVLCSTDALYTERAADTVAALRATGARWILLAGRAHVPGLDGHLVAGGDAPAEIEGVYAAVEAALAETALEAR